MTRITEIIRAIENEQLNSEEDVRAKIVMKLLDALGYPSEFISTEVPVYYNVGCDRPNPKKADAICYTKKTPKPDRKTALSDEYRDTTLLVVEVKAPTEDLGDAKAQAEFYSHWTRAPLYCMTNGTSYRFFSSVLNASDKELSVSHPDELSKAWLQICEEFSFVKARSIKSEAISERDRIRPILTTYCTQIAKQDNHDLLDRSVRKHKRLDTDSALDIIGKDSSLLIFGEPGIGKSRLVEYLAAAIAQNYLSGKAHRIPVVIKARGWARSYHSIIDGIATEIANIAPEITSDFLIANQELFSVLVDGLDEARRERDLLFDGLSQYVRAEGTQLICTSRFEGDCSRVGIDGVELVALTDEQAISYLKEKGVLYPQIVMNHLSEAGRRLMHNPLHLSCLVKYLEVQGMDSVPKNLAAVYNECIFGMLESKVEPSIEVDAAYLIQQLGSYAYQKLLNPDTFSLRSFLLSSSIAPDEAERIEACGKKSGLLIVTRNGTEFSHTVFQEYLAARHLALQSESHIESFCKKYGNEEYFRSFFQILCGCIENEEKQAAVLDYLECNNLALYMDCLRSRFSLSEQMQSKLGLTDIKAIAKQALSSYVSISSTYLRSMKPYIPFWQSMSSVDAPIQAMVSYSPSTTVIHIELKEKTEDNRNVTVNLSDDEQGPVMIAPDGAIMPLISLRSSNHPEMHVYRIADMYGGIDCARELAISMVSDDIKGFFSSPATILKEPLGMRVGFIEEALSKCGIKMRDAEGRESAISLRSCNANIFAAIINGSPDRFVSVDGMTIPMSVLYCLMALLEKEGGNYLSLLPPKPDNIDSSSRWVWDLYKEETVKRCCATTLLECEKSYRQYIEIFMSELGPYLTTYVDGPSSLRISIKKGSGEGHESDWRIHVAPWPIDDDKDAAVEFVTDLFPDDSAFAGFEGRASKYKQVAMMYGRPGTSYHEWLPRSVGILRDNTYIRTSVIKRVKEEIGEIFKLN